MKTTESVSMSYRSFCTTKEYLGDTSMRGSRGGRDDLDPLPPPPPPEKFTLVKLPQIGLGPPFHPGKHK